MLCTFIKTPEGLQPLHALEETEEMEQEQEEIQWPKENPYIKAAEPAEFTAETKIDPDIAEMFMAPDVREGFAALGRALAQFGEALGKVVRAAADCIVAIARGADIAQLLKAAEVKAALKEAPPRVRHLAKHGKKYRTRKKNINRALRDYQRRHRKRDRP
jgi:hypothetical protein